MAIELANFVLAEPPPVLPEVMERHVANSLEVLNNATRSDKIGDFIAGVVPGIAFFSVGDVFILAGNLLALVLIGAGFGLQFA